MTLDDLLLRMCEVCSGGEYVCHERSLANYNTTRINIGHQHDGWMEFKEALRVQTHAEEKY